MLGPVGLDERGARAGPRGPRRPTAWARSWYVRSEARSSGRLSAMSAETTPTSVTSAMSRPLATRLVPTSTSDPARGEVVQDAVRGALALDDVAVQAADPQRREPLADLALHALRAAAQVADPRRRAGRAAGRDRPGAAAVVAAQRRAGLVVDERPVAVRAGLDRAAVAAHDHGRGPAPVEDEDRPVAACRVQRRQRRREGVRDEPPVARPRAPRAGPRPSRPAPCRRPARGGPPAGSARPARGPSSPPTGVAEPSTTAAPASRPSSIAASRAWKRGVRSLL